MADRFVPVTDAASLRKLLAGSHDAPVLLFKHDPKCSMSAAAHREMSELDDDVALIDVEHAEDVAREVEAQTGVPHASPQVIVVRDGQAIWSASRFEIKANAVAVVLLKHAREE